METKERIEAIAAKVHDAWWEEKKAQEFHAPLQCPIPGEKSKFVKACVKCHTDMYPYAELPDNVQEYDRVTVRTVLDSIAVITDGMSFGLAIEATKKGQKIARTGWNGKGIFVYIPADRGEMTNPYLAIDTYGLQTDNPDAPRCIVPWLASQTDMLADDWMIV